MSSKRKYTLELLNTIISNYNATLIGNYDETINCTKGIDFKCKCGNIGNKKFRSIETHGPLCKICMDKISADKAKKTNLDRYGTEFTFQSEFVKGKIKATVLDKYGTEYATQSQQVKDKTKKTCFNKFGAEYAFQTQLVKDKMKITNLDRYGTEYASQSDTIKERMKASNLDKYGVEYASQSNIIKEQIKTTNLDKYGVENVFQNKTIKEKIKATCLDKYGVIHPTQNAILAEKYSKKSYKSKDYKLPSGTTIKVQGYEPWALDILFKKYSETQIIIGDRTKVPEIWWTDNNNKRHRYYVDIYIPEENKLIEVKSTWTYTQDSKKEKIKQVPLECISRGYKYEYWVFSDDKTLEIISEFNVHT